MTRFGVALATAAEVPDGDEDTSPLVAALARLGVSAVPVTWDDDAVNWAGFDLVVVRTTWDYPPRREEFCDWVDRVSAVTRLANPAAVIRWNTDKRYLRDLAVAGVPIVPTRWLEPGDAVALPGAGEYVVKPTISAGSRDTARYGPEDADHATEHAAHLLATGRAVMVQPYLEAVDREGERGLLYLGGRFSHAIRKGPLLHRGATFVEGLYAEEDIEPATASDAEIAVADGALGAVPTGETLLYARADIAPGPGGEPALLELELTEPSLFLGFAQGAAERFASAIIALLERSLP